MTEIWTVYRCHACDWMQSEETDDLTCARCGEPRSFVEQLGVVRLPYPFCMRPAECAGRTSCPAKLSCSE